MSFSPVLAPTRLIAVTCSSLLLAALSGCPGEVGDTDAGPQGPTAEEACDHYVAAFCDVLEECSPVNFEFSYEDKAQCEERFYADCAQRFDLPGTSATPERFDACAGEIEDAGCDLFSTIDLPESCEPLEGSLTNGSVCGEDSQCEAAKCKAGNNTTGCGTCGNPVAEGGACSVSDDCDDGLYCNADDTCVAYASAGDSCAERACTAGTVCRAGGTCGAPLAAGATCDPNFAECDSVDGLWCNSSSAVCQQIQLANAGAPCGLIDGGLTLCRHSGVCNFDPMTGEGTCVAPAADGDNCNLDEGPGCLPGAECIDGICALVATSSCQ